MSSQTSASRTRIATAQAASASFSGNGKSSMPNQARISEREPQANRADSHHEPYSKGEHSDNSPPAVDDRIHAWLFHADRPFEGLDRQYYESHPASTSYSGSRTRVWATSRGETSQRGTSGSKSEKPPKSK